MLQIEFFESRDISIFSLIASIFKSMFYKLSNAADKEQIEEDLNLKFKYPNLYTPSMVINGLDEATVPMVTMENKEEIDFAIWGLLSENYKEDWAFFQEANNTLNVQLEHLKNIDWIKPAFHYRRALILVTGFFCYLLKKGVIYPYYVSMTNDKPFYIGGIYNELEDGFLSCALITTKANSFITNFHNIDNQMPLVITDAVVETWLSENTELDALENIITNPPNAKLRANPVEKVFFKERIVYDSFLNPVHYKDIPEGGESTL